MRVKKVPLVMQLERRDCGAACLSMIAAYYGSFISLEQTRIDCGVSKNGVNGKSIIRAAKSYGFNAKGYAIDADMIEDRVTLPCILHWEMSHFVVLCGFKGGEAYINNPGRGAMRLPYDEFEKRFTGICIDITPSESYHPIGEKKSMLSYAKKRLFGLGAVMLLMMLVMVINSCFGLIVPVMSRLYLDRILSGADVSYLSTFIIIMLALAAGQTVVSLAQSVYRLSVMGRLSRGGHASFMQKLFSLPDEFFLQRMSGDLMDRKEKNASVSLSVINIISPLIIQSVMMVFFLFVMIRTSPVLSVVGVITVLLNIFMARFISAKRTEFSRRYLSDSSKLSSVTLSGIDMMETILSSGAEANYLSLWRGYQERKNTGVRSFQRASAMLYMIPAFISRTSSYVVMAMAVYLIIQGDFTIGMMTAFLGYLTSFMTPAETLISSGEKLATLRADMERVEDVMEYRSREEVLPADADALPVGAGDSDGASAEVFGSVDSSSLRLSGAVSVRGVSFGYSALEPPVLKDIDMDITPGSFVAIVGHSGSGKTTLIRLLTGLYTSGSGTISYDGMDIATIDHSTFTKNVAVVDQDIRFFNDTIKNNLTLWDDDISDSDIVEACKKAFIYDDIMAREGGFSSVLSDNGSDLSGGQRQRLDIARALLKKPSVLILDETTASLDAITERRVIDSIRSEGITCIIITHRISAIRDCDEIFVMDAGRIVAHGSHDVLYEKNGLYRTLISNE